MSVATILVAGASVGIATSCFLLKVTVCLPRLQQHNLALELHFFVQLVFDFVPLLTERFSTLERNAY